MATKRERALFRIAERLSEKFPGSDVEEFYSWMPEVIPLSYQEAEEDYEQFHDECFNPSPDAKPSVLSELRTELCADGMSLATVVKAATDKVKEHKQLREENERLKAIITDGVLEKIALVDRVLKENERLKAKLANRHEWIKELEHQLEFEKAK